MVFTIRRAAAMSLGFVLLACSAGCTSSEPAASGSPATAATKPAAAPTVGTVTGTVRLVGGAAPGTNKPVAGQVFVYSSARMTGSPVAAVHTAPDGGFSLTLSPGTYYLAAASPIFDVGAPPSAPPCHGSAPAVVSRANASVVDVLCEMR